MGAAAKAFAGLLAPSEALARYEVRLQVGPRGAERVAIEAALGRVLAADVVASVDLPPFPRSTADGWAVQAADTSAAAADRPARLNAAGQVQMGAEAAVAVVPGTAVRIPTGGMLPPGADAVVMQEDADTEGAAVLVRRPVRAGDNVVGQGADVRAGAVVLRRGRRLRPADLGVLAGLGFPDVEVVLPPRVAILATGDEVRPPGAVLGPGQVRDMNSYTLAAAVLAAGGLPTLCGIVGDQTSAVESAIRRALEGHEMVLVSGGSSVGERDVAVDAIAAVGPPGIIVHGIAVRPGKPTVLALAGTVPVIGLPGNPVSALVIFDLFARPVLERMLGLDPTSAPWHLVRAKLTAPLPGAGGREDHRRVRLESRPDGLWAVPLPAGSQILTSLVHADGVVRIPPGGAFQQGEEVEVRLLR
ncbi:MAG: molybdopterin molybdotransferase MoeA [Armatimonadota bacterium]|nr:molybdopterin molybdotransferase MoeA [Armatimonadota bacterium]MDR7518937.1 molybdopterin molybdotransferase MoeA [Armatimonadota bacterium]